MEVAWGQHQCLGDGEVLSSAASMEIGDGDLCGSSDTRDIDVLETTEVPENDHMESPAWLTQSPSVTR